MYSYSIKKVKSKKKKGPQINMAPTLNIFGFVSRFWYSGCWQVCLWLLLYAAICYSRRAEGPLGACKHFFLHSIHRATLFLAVQIFLDKYLSI